MDNRFDGRVFVITGAAGQIGAETALRFAAEGAKVVATDVDEGRLSSVFDRIGNSGRDAIAVAADLAHTGAAERVVEQRSASLA